MATRSMMGSRPPLTIERIGTFFLCTAVVALWAQGWLPNLTTMLTAGRGYISGLGSTVEQTQLATSISSILAISVAALVLMAILFGLPSIRHARPLPFLTLLAAWVVLYPWHGTSGVNIATVIFPLIALAWMLLRPDSRPFYRLLAWIGVMTATGSILFALVSPLAFMPAQWTLDADKALLGNNILAGPYSHSNALGLSLVLTLPFVVTYFRGRALLMTTLLMSIALLWSSSRLSTVAAALTLILSLCAVRMSPRRGRTMLSFVAVAAAIFVVGLPLLTSDPLLFTNRGGIWMTSLDFAQREFLTGYGWDVYREVNELTTTLGFVSTTGHNIFVTFLTTGGIVTVILVGSMLLMGYRNGRRSFDIDRTRLLFLAVLLIVGFAEDPTRAFTVGPQSFVIYPMFIIFLDPPRRSGGSDSSGPTATSAPTQTSETATR